MKKLSVKYIGIILAAGKGERTGFDKPKQLIKLAGKPIIEHTISVFQNNQNIDEIIIVSNNETMDSIEEIVINGHYNKVSSVILGGSERYHSSLAAINATAKSSRDYDVKLIFHDAVRPLLSNRVLDDVIRALNKYNAIDVVIRATDTIIEADLESNTINSIPDRAKLRNGQTPQAFKYETIKEAYEIALDDKNFQTTDDCGVVKKYLPNEPIYLVEGEQSNIKLTYAEDLQILDKLMQTRQMKIGDINSFEFASLKDKVIIVFGGSSGIGADILDIAKSFKAKVISASRSTGVDIASRESVNRCFEEALKMFGKVDYVINTAAVLYKKSLENMTVDEINDAINTNYFGVINVAIEAIKHLRLTKGHLLNFTSSSYTYGRANYSMYSSSKAAVVNITQALAQEWHIDGVRVNCINPERTNTPMRKKAFGNEPLDTLMESKEVARKSLKILLTDVTGQIFDLRK